MKPSDFIHHIQSVADTDKKHSHVTASDVSRVVSIAFRILAMLEPADALDTLAKLSKLAAARNEKMGKKDLRVRKKPPAIRRKK